MAKETKLYDLLGVTPEASESELKKAYRQKALRAHPDKGGDPETFKELTHAYEVLSDSQKRGIYDRYGEAGLSEAGGAGGVDPQDLFSQLFGGGGGPFGGGFFGGGGRPSGPRKGKDLIHRIHVSLEELYKGKTSKLSLNKHVICSKCNGKGGKEGAVKTCPSCRGQGVKIVIRQLGPMMQQIQQQCTDCDGTGEIINPKDRCKQCNGKKTISEKKVLEVHIDKGMKGGETITFAGESDQAPDMVPGDVVIVIEEKKHDRFTRKGNDLIAEVDIDLLSALGGGSFAIQHLDERALMVTIVPGEIIKDGAVKVIHGQGMPSRRHHDFGDLYVRLKVNFPESIDPAVIPLLEQALPPRKVAQKFAKNIHIDEVVLAEPDARQQRAANDDMEVDEDEDGAGPRVQCQNQ
ncbi:hypothetical protein CALVIDRAFT_537836 [Calocera viscosa TUFC12733]|uniref:DnaJ-domain-containing protein n=1 Tax=Calocera viscosa (strain TUFC12733) TaxID=1330018 RepID=A0A167LNA2_CALVF|nr:hypothetical protein CALVIDRAFT_537836 [Calocera viscosa TUFC12733]